MDKRVCKLVRKKQYAQRTQEWFDVRKNLITASSAASCLTRNLKTCESYVKEYSLEDIFDYNDKCCNPYSTKKQYFLDKTGHGGSFKGNTATYWGQKYEPVVTDLYSKNTNKEVMEFGLILHDSPDLHFLGASPDGITPDGVMIEIKCPFRRKITGVPPLYYWIQVQLQLEVCDLDFCDFVEYTFVEFLSEEEFLDDSTIESFTPLSKGAIIQIDKGDSNGDPSQSQYIYPPKEFLNSDKDIILWVNTQLEKLPEALKQQDEFVKISPIYWKVSEKNVLRIKRDKTWFNNVKEDLKTTYDKILYYKTDDNYLELLKKKKEFVKGKSICLDFTSDEEDEKCIF